MLLNSNQKCPKTILEVPKIVIFGTFEMPIS